MMSAVAMYRDDISGALVTAGSSTAYTVTSYSTYDSLAHLDGQTIAFSPHATNGATVTLAVDGLAAKPLRSAPNTELPAGTLIQGTPYVALFNNSDGAFYLRGFVGNPYNIPISGSMIYFGPTAPNSSFIFPFGQAISRAIYSSLYSGNPWSIGTTYGVGDGSTTFNVPDCRGRVVAGKDDMGGSAVNRLTSTYFGVSSGQAGTTLGAVGGAESSALQQTNLPNVNFTGTTSGFTSPVNYNTFNINGLAGGPIANVAHDVTTATPSISLNSGGSGTSFQNVPPTIIGNFILRVI